MPQLGAGGRGEVAGDGDTGGHVTHVTTAGLRTRVIGAQADQVAIRLLGEDWSELSVGKTCYVVIHIDIIYKASRFKYPTNNYERILLGTHHDALRPSNPGYIPLSETIFGHYYVIVFSLVYT